MFLMCIYKKGHYLYIHGTHRARITGGGVEVCVCVCVVCVHSVMEEPLRLSFSDADGGYKFITPSSRQPIILNTVVLLSHTVHICVCMCATPRCVQMCVFVCTPQSGVRVSKLVKVKQIGGVT